MRCLFTCAAGLLTTMLLTADVAAVDIERADAVSSVQIEPVGTFFDLLDKGQVVDQIALVGREQCIKMFEDDTPISFGFNYSGSAHSAWVFAAPTQVTPDEFACNLEERTSCTDVENVDEFRPLESGISATYGLTIDFDELVEEAVQGQEFVSEEQPGNGIALLKNVEDCTDVQVDQQYFFRLIFDGGTQARGQLFDAVIEVDTQPPVPPSSVDRVVVTESSVFASWEHDDPDNDLNLGLRQELNRVYVQPFVVYYSNRDITGSSRAELEAATDVVRETLVRDDPDSSGPSFAGNAKLEGIDTGPDARVWIAVAAQDDVGNIGEPAYPEGDGAENGFEPIPVIDFWEGYRESGGQESGGCNAAPGAPVGPVALWLAALGLGWLGWRRRRRLRQLSPLAAGVLICGATIGVSDDAAAQSPTWGTAEVRLGGYYPSIDEESGLTGQPFQDSFGSGNRVLFEYEQGIHLFDAFGAFGASASIGYTHFGGEIQIEDGTDIEGLDESTGFMVVPARLGLYYRVDQFEKLWDIPLVPVVKGGLDYILWQAEEPNGDTSTVGGDEGEGGTYGWHVSAGLHLLLDWIEPSSAASFDYSWGINNTYAFAEYMHMEVDDFGASDSFILSDDLWMFGLAFEY